jgi:hypothetical protein
METDKPAGASGMTSSRGDHTGTREHPEPFPRSSPEAREAGDRSCLAPAVEGCHLAVVSRPHPEASVAVKHPTWFTVFITVAMLHLAGQLFGKDALHLVTKPLLMPALLAWFLTATPRSRFRTLVAVGLAWSWLGDLGLMPSGEAWFLAGLGAFLIAQVTYGVAPADLEAGNGAAGGPLDREILARPVTDPPQRRLAVDTASNEDRLDRRQVEVSLQPCQQLGVQNPAPIRTRPLRRHVHPTSSVALPVAPPVQPNTSACERPRSARTAERNAPLDDA